MGTNYYVKEHCEYCGYSHDMHLGKSSVGWCFSLRVYPESEINTLADWLIMLRDASIHDEYGCDVTYDEMMQTITERSGHNRFDEPLKPVPPFQPLADWDEFLRRNHAERGPNGLMRHVIDGDFCVGHGDGTWDYIAKEFC